MPFDAECAFHYLERYYTHCLQSRKGDGLKGRRCHTLPKSRWLENYGTVQTTLGP